MNQNRKILLVVSSVIVLFVVTIFIFLLRPPNLTPADDGRSQSERREIVEACFAMLNSSLTNEVDIKPDDKRLPEVIRALPPIGIEVTRDFSVNIYREGKPEGYFLVRNRQQSSNTWILCIAGPSVGGGGREILRVERE